MSVIIGVDPGVKGGIAILDRWGTIRDLQAISPKMTERDLCGMVRGLIMPTRLDIKGVATCFFEKVHYKRGDGGQGAFTFGRVNGLLAGMLLTYGLKPRYVPPVVWQSRLDCLTGGRKIVTRIKALRLFARQGWKITDATADALLIAEYGRRVLGGRVGSPAG